MPSFRRIIAAVAAVLVAGTACGGDGTGLHPTLSDTEFTAMLNAFSHVGEGAAAFSVLPSPRGALAASRLAATTTSSTTIDSTYNCAGGGTARFLENFVTAFPDAQTIALTGTATVTLTGCKEAASTGEQFTFNSSPSLLENLSLTLGSTSSSSNVHMTGALKWGLNGRSGTCDFDVTLVTAESSASSTSTVSGTICGRPAPQSFAGAG